MSEKKPLKIEVKLDTGPLKETLAAIREVAENSKLALDEFATLCYPEIEKLAKPWSGMASLLASQTIHPLLHLRPRPVPIELRPSEFDLPYRERPMGFYPACDIQLRRPEGFVMMVIDEAAGWNPPKLKPLRRKNWRRPKVWRARDILEQRCVQGAGFRGLVRSAKAIRNHRRQAMRNRITEHKSNLVHGQHILDEIKIAWAVYQRHVEPVEWPGQAENPYLNRYVDRAAPMVNIDAVMRLPFRRLEDRMAFEDIVRRGLSIFAEEAPLNQVVDAIQATRPGWLMERCASCINCGNDTDILCTFPMKAGKCPDCYYPPIKRVPRGKKRKR